jgi:hypothetical protein
MSANVVKKSQVEVVFLVYFTTIGFFRLTPNGWLGGGTRGNG